MKHPEQQSDEVFICNIAYSQVDELGWNTKRLGDVARDVYGKVLSPASPVVKPVFVKRAEIVAKMNTDGCPDYMKAALERLLSADYDPYTVR